VIPVYIGAHLSIRRGYGAAARRAASLGMTAFQFFSKNPRGLSVKSFDRPDAESCKRFLENHRLKAIIHAPYPVNLAADDDELRSATVRCLLNDLDICDACGALGVVVHFGKRSGDVLESYRLIIRTLDEVLASWHGKARLLLENQAGEGGALGTTFEELTQIRNLTDYPEKIGFCFDTCHAFASGLWNGNNTDELLARGEELAYWEHLEAIHLNDSMHASGQRRDRHAPLGKGKIGLEALRRLIERLPSSGRVPLILETPEQKDDSHPQQIASFKRLIT